MFREELAEQMYRYDAVGLGQAIGEGRTEHGAADSALGQGARPQQ